MCYLFCHFLICIFNTCKSYCYCIIPFVVSSCFVVSSTDALHLCPLCLPTVSFSLPSSILCTYSLHYNSLLRFRLPLPTVALVSSILSFFVPIKNSRFIRAPLRIRLSCGHLPLSFSFLFVFLLRSISSKIQRPQTHLTGFNKRKAKQVNAKLHPAPFCRLALNAP